MKMKSKTKGIIKKVALALAGVAAITAVGFGVKAIVDYTKNDLKKITLSYDVGNLGADGKYVADEGTLYTKEAFGCYGLQVKPDFDSTVNYKVFYYDILDNYISSTEVLSDGYSGKVPVNGAYARIVIEPKEDEDGKISLMEKLKYSSQLTVKVKKSQDINDRFVVFKGKILDVVADTESLIFVNGVCFDTNDTLNWSFDDKYATTSSTVLKVNGGYTFNYDFTGLGENYSSAYSYIYEFSDLPSMDNYIGCKKVLCESPSDLLNNKTKYIIISVSTGKSDVSWTETELKNLPLCFSVTKTK